MPYYTPLKDLESNDRKRIVSGLKRLRKQLEDLKFPKKKSSETLILGTWNLRDFDSNKFGYGPRLVDSFYYIAEIISNFDVIAVQEINENLKPLKDLLHVLSRDYDFILTDVTDSSLGGNKERLGFIYDTKKVRFTGIAGEIVLPNKMLISESEKQGRQFSRTPFGVGFQSEWFKFNFSSVHIYFGSNSNTSIKYKRRIGEIEAIAKYLSREAKRSFENNILVGDFNIKEIGSEGYNVLQKHGFTIVQNREGSNKDRTRFYDQISFMSQRNELELVPYESEDRVIQFLDSVFRDEDFKTYKPIMIKMIETHLKEINQKLDKNPTKAERKKLENSKVKLTDTLNLNDDNLLEYYKEWRTFQISDHLPLWVEIKINFSGQYLDYLEKFEEIP